MDNEIILPEVRDGFKVTAKRKKLWRVEMEILREFDRVCQKYGITWYADYGTLLGAVRHQGFIPWDDDIDVSIMRKDYNRFIEAASKEFSFPYKVHDPENDSLLYFFTKIYNANTSFISYPNVPPERIPQAIFIDVFPLDDIGICGAEEVARSFFLISTNLRNGDEIYEREFIESHKLPISLKDLDVIKTLNRSEIFDIYNDFSGRHCGIEEYVGYSVEEWLHTDYKPRKRIWYGEPVMLQFEDIMLPCPCDYEKCLEAEYGDWKVFKKPENGIYHKAIIEPDIPYMDLMSL